MPEAFPCDDFPGDPTFQRVSGEIDGYVLVPWYDPAGSEAGVVVLDSDGCSRMSIAVDPYVTAARWSGDEIWYNQMGDVSVIHRVDMLTGEDDLIDTPDGHHDFFIHPDGTVAWLLEEVREIEGEDVAGDILRERAPDGTETDVWHAFDDLEIVHHPQWNVSMPRDWTHANGLAYDPVRQTYLVSLYWLKEIIEVDPRLQQHTRSLKGEDLADPFGPQHAPSTSPEGGLRMFDNSGASGHSRLLEVDWDGNVLWDWGSEDALASPVLGDFYMREDGVIIASFGAEGVVLAVKDGQEIWRVSAPSVVIGRVDWRAELPG